jgi:hypothetical protein
MSVRFSLRFAGRSWGRLLGVPNWPEVGRGSVVAIIVGVVVVVVFVYSYPSFMFLSSLTSPCRVHETRSQLPDPNPESLTLFRMPQIVGVGQRLGDIHCALIPYEYHTPTTPIHLPTWSSNFVLPVPPRPVAVASTTLATTSSSHMPGMRQDQSIFPTSGTIANATLAPHVTPNPSKSSAHTTPFHKHPSVQSPARDSRKTSSSM